MKSKQLKSALKLITLFLLFFAGIHYLAINFLLPTEYNQIDVLFIYLFLGFLSLFGIWAIFTIHTNDDSLIGKGYLVLTVIKLLGSALFLAPWIMNQDQFTRPFVYQFFALFFPLLLVETVLILKIINVLDAEKVKNDQIQLEK